MGGLSWGVRLCIAEELLGDAGDKDKPLKASIFLGSMPRLILDQWTVSLKNNHNLKAENCVLLSGNF